MQVQSWRRIGQIVDPFALAHRHSWWQSHASYPTALVEPDAPVKIFFSVRDAENRSHLAEVSIVLEDVQWQFASEVNGPLFSPGARGAFDADGVTPTSFVRNGDRLYAYYLGWTQGVTVPFTNFIGLATSGIRGRNWQRFSEAPIIGRSGINPFTVGYPWVLRLGEEWRMWFGSHLSWGATGLEMQHIIRTATSSDGREWSVDREIAIPLAGAVDPAEFAVSRPCVLFRDGRFLMWYARRRPKYQLGLAASDDGRNWTRHDAAVVFTSPAGDWETHEQTYPCVFPYRDRVYMLYNGDQYGRTGFGLAVLE